MLDSTNDVQTTMDETPMVSEPYGLRDLMALDAKPGAISPAMARHMRDTMHFDRQRPISARNVERLAEEMRRGWFLAGTPIFICVLPDGRQLIVNGNHTLEAVVASGVTVPLTIIRKQVRDVEAAAKAYAVLDIQKTRSWTDTLRAIGHAETIPMAVLVNSAMSFILGGFRDRVEDRQAAASRNLRMAEIPEYKAAAHLLAQCIENAPRSNVKLLRRASVFSVALYTARYQPSAAEECWGGMVRDDGLKANDPRKALLRYLVNHHGTGSGGRRDCVRAAISAWNAGFQNRSLDHCRPSNSAEIRILGTPLHKGGA